MASPTTQTTHPAPSLALLAHLARVGQREGESSLSDDLRTAHLMLLTLLRDHGPTTQTGLAEALRLDPSNLVGLLNDLERRDMVIRQHHPDDRRRHVVTIAEAGITELQSTEQRLAAVEDRVLGALNPEERATLHCLLMRAAGGQLPPNACTPIQPD
jgi:DNA-binding MarR family transcriptional regulator